LSSAIYGGPLLPSNCFSDFDCATLFCFLQFFWFLQLFYWFLQIFIFEFATLIVQLVTLFFQIFWFLRRFLFLNLRLFILVFADFFATFVLVFAHFTFEFATFYFDFCRFFVFATFSFSTWCAVTKIKVAKTKNQQRRLSTKVVVTRNILSKVKLFTEIKVCTGVGLSQLDQWLAELLTLT